MHVILHLAVLAATILLLARLFPGVRIRDAGSAIVVAITFSVLNFFLGWLIKVVVSALIAVPAIFTLGLLFLLVPFLVNVILLWMTDKLLASFELANAGSLLLSSAVITVVNWFFYAPQFHAIATRHLSPYGAGRGWI